MAKRNHALKVGELVFDYNVGYWGNIINISEHGAITLEMDGWALEENLKMFDSEIPEEEYVWTTDRPDMLYQKAPGLVGRDGNPICYEHNPTEDEYPYFSPYLDENLFSFEAFNEGEYVAFKTGNSVEYGQDIVKVINDASTVTNPTPVVVEDENGEIRNITYAWYDNLNGMVRLSVAGTVFQDAVDE